MGRNPGLLALQVHVEDVVLGEGDAAEQVISLAGPLQHMQIALPIILEKVESSRGPGQGFYGLPGFHKFPVYKSRSS